MNFWQRLLALIDGEPVIFTNLGAAILALFALLHFNVAPNIITAVGAIWAVFVAILRAIVVPASKAHQRTLVALSMKPPDTSLVPPATAKLLGLKPNTPNPAFGKAAAILLLMLLCIPLERIVPWS